MQARVEGLFDVTDVVALSKVLVNEGVHIAQLQFDRGAHVIETHHLRIVADDLEATLQVAQVVISHLEHE